MKRAVAILLGVAAVCLVAYVSWLNPTPVEFHFSATRTMQAPLATLLVFAFVIGVLVVLLITLVQAGRRALVAWRLDRRQRRVERIEDWEERGEQLIWNGDVVRGRSLLQKAWQQRPEDVHALLALTASYRDTGEVGRARELLAQAVEQRHTDPDLLMALAESHRAAGNRRGALDVLERVRALHPRAPRVLRALRDAYAAEQRWTEAATVQEQLVTHIRDADEATHARDYLLALRYQAALNVSDAAARAQLLGGLADARAGLVPVLVSLGDALRAAGRQDEASVIWERALRSTPRSVFVERLASIAVEPRHRDRLRTLLRKLRTDQVRADNVHLWMARLHLADGAVDEAARELETAQQSGLPAPGLQQLWADVHRRRGQVDQAVTALSSVDGTSPAYHCIACERAAADWTGYCPRCGYFDSYRAGLEISAA